MQTQVFMAPLTSMPKKPTKKEELTFLDEIIEPIKINEISEQFSNGELNILRDKLNEVIRNLR